MTTTNFKPAYKKHMVIGCQPGFYAIDFQLDPEDKSPPFPKKIPVVSWLVSIYEGRDIGSTLTIAKPITHEITGSLYEGAVLYPDGKVIIPGDRCYYSLADYADEKRKDWHNNQSTIASKIEELSDAGTLKEERERVAIVTEGVRHVASAA